MVDLRQLRYFVAVVEAGSLTRAAERLHVAQSALSLHVRKMEEHFGVPLLLRGPKGVRPTTAGQKLLDHAHAILGMMTKAEQELRGARETPDGPVSIGIPSGVGRLLNAPLLEACRLELPRVSLRIVEVLPGHVSEWLAAGLIQLGVRYDMGEPKATPLAEEEFHLVCGAPERALGENVALADLPQFPLVLPACSHNPQECAAVRAEKLGIRLNISSRVDSLATILDLVCNQGRRSILTPGACLPEWRQGKLFAYPITPVMKRSVMLEIGDSARGEPAVQAVAVIVRRTAEALRSEGAWPRRLPVLSAAA